MADQHFTPEELASEEWRPVVGAEGSYSVSSLGRVRSEDRVLYLRDGRLQRHGGKPLAVHPNPHRMGYVYTALRFDRQPLRSSRVVHRLVAEAFLRPLRNGEEVNHIDFDTANNRATNLEIVTHVENVGHTVRAGRNSRGERTVGSKLVPDDIRYIFGLRGLGLSHSEISALVGVSQTQVQRILAGTRWQHMTAGLVPVNPLPDAPDHRGDVLSIEQIRPLEEAQPRICRLVSD